jgi:hypothetical protein
MFDEPELRVGRALRAEWRDDEEAWSRAALERWEQDRTLVDVLRDCMHRGDTVAFAFAACTFTGPIVAVGSDLVRVATAAGGVDVRVEATLPGVVRVVGRVPRGGARGDGGVTTFLARLRQLDATRVRIGTDAAGHVATGELRLARDHVSVVDRDGDRLYLPMASVRWVRPDEDD